MKIRLKSIFICVICVAPECRLNANTVSTASFRDEVNTFLGKELAAHLGAIKSLDPPPDRILGVPTTGEFSWGTFMRSLAAYADTTGNRELAGRDHCQVGGPDRLDRIARRKQSVLAALCGARVASLWSRLEDQSALAGLVAGGAEGVALAA